MAGVKFFLFGAPRVENNGLPLKLASRKTLALLAYLALEQAPLRRDSLLTLLWPEEPLSHARALFRRTLSGLKSALPQGWLRAEQELIRFQPGPDFWLDVLEFQRLLASCRLHGHPETITCPDCQPLLEQAVALYQGDFMSGFSLADSINFDDWQVLQCEALRREMLSALAKLVDCLILKEDFPAALPPARRRLAIDPLSEAAHCDLMRLYFWTHQRSAALRQFEVCRTLLHTQLGVEPLPTTIELGKKIESGSLADPQPQFASAGTIPLVSTQVTIPQAALSIGDTTARPPVETLRGNLPLQLTSFIGREKVIAEVLRLLAASPSRLVTLTGSGGTGKSRLALQVAERLQPSFPDGVWLLELAPLSDPQLVPQSLARLFDLSERPETDFTQALCAHLKHRRLLLVLDNCEHLLDASAILAKALLQSSLGLRILATSRQRLGVQGEIPFTVPPLSYPERDQALQWEDLAHYEAPLLFVDRVSTTLPNFALPAENADSVIEICRRLDGIPLAIELAAAQTRLLSLRQISDRLQDAFHLLAAGDRTDLPRHQTLRAMIEWSYDLLTPSEQTMLHNLSIFAGGWTLEAAENVCAGLEGAVHPLQKDQVVDLLGGLVDKSLVQFQPTQADEPRYRMLETVRQYARERLLETGDDSELRECHMQYFYRLSIRSNPPGSHQSMSWEWQQSLIREIDNFRLAVQRATEIDQAVGLRICVQLDQAIPVEKNHELVRWMESLLAAEAKETTGDGGQPRTLECTIARGDVLTALGDFRTYWGQSELAKQALLESKTIFEEILQSKPAYFPYTVSRTYMCLGILYLTSDPEQSLSYLKTALDLALEHGEHKMIPRVYTVLANVYGYFGELDQAVACAEEGLRLSRVQNQIFDEGLITCYIGQFESMRGNKRANEYYQQSLDLWSKLQGFENNVSWVLFELARAAWGRGEIQQVLQKCDAMTALYQETKCPRFDLNSQVLRAWVEWGQGDYDLAARRCQEALDAYSQTYMSYTLGQNYVLGRVALSRGEPELAAHYFRQVDAMADAPRWWWKPYGLHGFGLVAAAQASVRPGMAERAAVLFGAQESLFAWLPNYLSPVEKSEYERAAAAARAVLGAEAYDAAWVRGRSMPREQIFAFARAEQGNLKDSALT